ncbi:hypothetical protein D910_03793 [Dendroctonus ponderosae]
MIRFATFMNAWHMSWRVDELFVETEERPMYYESTTNLIFALDCEMSYTAAGLEVVKVAVLNCEGVPIYVEYIRPLNPIVDYNTRFSGIVAEDFINNSSKTLKEVQKDLKKFIFKDTVLIGHGLENDLKGLKIIHKTVVDTAFTFPHHSGFPFKQSLKYLVQSMLGQSIQGGTTGHDPCEDARNRTVFIWDTKELVNKDRKSLRVNIDFDYATHVKWSPDCKAFVIHKFNENCLEVYKVDKKKDGWLTASKAVTFPKGHETDVIGMGIASNGKFIMTCSNKTDMIIWDLKGEKLVKLDTFLMSTFCAKISPCGRFVVASGK